MRRTFAGIMLAGLLATACAGGGSGDGDGGNGAGAPRDATAVLLAAPGKAADAGTARMVMNMTTSFGETSVTFGGTGALDFAGSRGTFTFDLSNLLSAFGGAAPPKGTELKIEMRFTDTHVFMRLPAEAQTGKPWVSFDLTKLAEASGSSGGLFSGSDPSQFFDALRGVSGQVKVEGSATVRGVATTEYSALIDVEKAVSTAPAAQREALRESLKAFGTSSFPIRVWVGDDDGLVYKQSLTINAEGAAAKVDVEFFDYGAAVEIDLPPPSQVNELRSEAEIGKFLAGLGGA